MECQNVPIQPLRIRDLLRPWDFIPIVGALTYVARLSKKARAHDAPPFFSRKTGKELATHIHTLGLPTHKEYRELEAEINGKYGDGAYGLFLRKRMMPGVLCNVALLTYHMLAYPYFVNYVVAPAVKIATGTLDSIL